MGGSQIDPAARCIQHLTTGAYAALLRGRELVSLETKLGGLAVEVKVSNEALGSEGDGCGAAGAYPRGHYVHVTCPTLQRAQHRHLASHLNIQAACVGDCGRVADDGLRSSIGVVLYCWGGNQVDIFGGYDGHIAPK